MVSMFEQFSAFPLDVPSVLFHMLPQILPVLKWILHTAPAAFKQLEEEEVIEPVSHLFPAFAPAAIDFLL
jgi:hypothetical protein